MNAIWMIAAILGVVLIGLVVWVLVQNTQDQKNNEQLETQMNELRRDLLGLSTAQTQSTTKLETIAESVASRLEAVTTAVRDGLKDGLQGSAEVTSKITSEAQAAMSTELRNTREQLSQMQKQIGEVQQAGQQMHQTAQTLENILGGTKSRGSFGEVTLERLLEDALPRALYATQHRFRSGEAADAVIFLRDKKLVAIDSKFPLDAYLRLTTEGEDARKTFVAAVKTHADSIARKYIVADEGTLDFAMLFVPSETVYYELLMSADSKGVMLDAYCRDKKIVAVSPNTLYAHLCVIDMGMRGMQIEENAKRLSDNLRGMRTQLDKFSESFEKIGTHLKNAQLSYAEADKRFDRTSNTLDTMLSGADPAQSALEESQGTLALPGVSAKQSA
jgi:DNA recombination protein RmuC